MKKRKKEGERRDRKKGREKVENGMKELRKGKICTNYMKKIGREEKQKETTQENQKMGGRTRRETRRKV